MIGPSWQQRSSLVILFLSALILIFLFWLIYFNPGQETQGSWVSLLPTLNASLNSLTTFLLIIGYIFIKKDQRKLHIFSMLAATTTSGLFLISYITYHHFQGDTLYLTQGWLRPTYFFILITHIVLSMGLVPLVLMTLFQAWKKNFITHKKIARITFPIWIYVSVTGVLIYLFVHYLNFPQN